MSENKTLSFHEDQKVTNRLRIILKGYMEGEEVKRNVTRVNKSIDDESIAIIQVIHLFIFCAFSYHDI